MAVAAIVAFYQSEWHNVLILLVTFSRQWPDEAGAFTRG